MCFPKACLLSKTPLAALHASPHPEETVRAFSTTTTCVSITSASSPVIPMFTASWLMTSNELLSPRFCFQDFLSVCKFFVNSQMGSCQNYWPFLGTLNNRCRIIIGTQKRAIILTTTQMVVSLVFISAHMSRPRAISSCCKQLFQEAQVAEFMTMSLLGGSWVVRSWVTIAITITHLTGLRTPLKKTTHEPPKKKFRCSSGSSSISLFGLAPSCSQQLEVAS